MGRKKQTAAEHFASADERGCNVASMQACELNPNKVEIADIADLTKEKHEDVVEI
jgi:hypothetical protein